MEENDQQSLSSAPTNKAVAWALGHKAILAAVAVAAVVLVATALHVQSYAAGTSLPLTKTLEHDGVWVDYPRGWEAFQSGDYALISSSGVKGEKDSPEQLNGYVTITTHAIESDFDNEDALEVFDSLKVISGKGTVREFRDGSFSLTDASGDVICMAQWGNSR
ncbi:hypothetical protein AAK967_02715 [Atopobiaceae bacterium 24-176]